ncbi:hypothetical protein [Marinobacter sp.]|uniref:hypothetical protein n=1 Tax=Marinobacter sp. TaxID=50741 RepID=UPI003413B831
MKLQHVPTIDLGPYFEGSTDGKQQVAEAVDRACQDKADRPRPDMVRGYSAAAEGTNIEEDQMGAGPRSDYGSLTIVKPDNSPGGLQVRNQIVKEPYTTYYNWYQAVLLDPEGNVFRINHMM